jgi:hypothetical protein
MSLKTPGRRLPLGLGGLSLVVAALVIAGGPTSGLLLLL